MNPKNQNKQAVKRESFKKLEDRKEDKKLTNSQPNPASSNKNRKQITQKKLSAALRSNLQRRKISQEIIK